MTPKQKIAKLEKEVEDLKTVLKEAAKHESPWQIVKNWFSAK